ncbi:lanthionine synthetase LanC family protein [Acidobacteriota bacterium]
MDNKPIPKRNIAFFPFFLILCLVLGGITTPGCRDREVRDGIYMEAAREAARWIQSTSMEIESGGRIWPAVPGDKASVGTTLYSGVPGTVLFFLELYTATKDIVFLQEAQTGADFLLSRLDEEKMYGLYVGISGIGYALQETFKTSREQKYHDGFLRCLDLLKENSQQDENGIHWGPVTDLISGNTGIGLFLIYASDELGESTWLDLAAQVGQQLLFQGLDTETGTQWAMSAEFPRHYPNFSHGTAGTAYFLASLYLKTGTESFLEAAVRGAQYLLNVAESGEEGEVCLIFHHEPGGEDLYYLGWCHGPVGTARLFFRLYEITQDEIWMNWLEKGANAILESGIPEIQTTGFWNNLGVCCGSAGVADFFLSLYNLTQKERYLSFAKILTEKILSKRTQNKEGVYWIHAEHRSQPELLLAQTGLMQGAAGIGLWLLHLDAHDKGLKRLIVLPDNPFR